MRRYWVSANNFINHEVHFSGDAFHHIFDVCRQDVGSRFEVLQEDGKAYFVEVMSRQKKAAIAKILEVRILPKPLTPQIHLCLSLPRFPVFEAVLEKSVELGVAAIHPFYSDFSFLRKEDSVSDAKWDRWQKILISATQQTGRGDLMKISSLQTRSDLLKEFSASSTNPKARRQGLFCYEASAEKGGILLKEALQAISKEQCQEIWVFIGSEGGFSNSEVLEFEKHDLRPVSLGPQILRVETACITLVSVLKYEFDLMKGE